MMNRRVAVVFLLAVLPLAGAPFRFIVLGDRTGNVEPGTMVEVQLLEGIV